MNTRLFLLSSIVHDEIGHVRTLSHDNKVNIIMRLLSHSIVRIVNKQRSEALRKSTNITIPFACGICFSVEVNWDGKGWIKGNVGQTGFYRVNYEESNWDALAEQLQYYYKVKWYNNRYK